jgi:hypothetical protein
MVVLISTKYNVLRFEECKRNLINSVGDFTKILHKIYLKEIWLLGSPATCKY